MSKAITLTSLAHRAALRNVSIVLAATVVAAIAIIAAREDLVRHLDAIEASIESFGAGGVLAFIALFVVATSLLLPESLLSVLAGAAFGLSKGVTVAVAANFVAAAMQFLLARSLNDRLLQSAIHSRPALIAIQQAVRASGPGLQWLLRLTPLNPAAVSYVLSAAGVPFSTFMLATSAILPHTLVEVYFGYAAKHLTRMAVRSPGATHLHDLVIVGGLILTVLTILLISRAAHRAVQRATEAAPVAATQCAAGSCHRGKAVSRRTRDRSGAPP